MNWKLTKDELPKEHVPVLIAIGNMTHVSKESEYLAMYDVAWIEKGISEEERNNLPDDDDRKNIYESCDEHGNNLVPYSWETFGPQEYFGQDVYAWAYIDYCPFKPESDTKQDEYEDLKKEFAKEFVEMLIGASVDELMEKNENLTKEMNQGFVSCKIEVQKNMEKEKNNVKNK